MERTRRKNAAGDWLRGEMLAGMLSVGLMFIAVAGFGLGFVLRGLPVFDGLTGTVTTIALAVGVLLAFAVCYRFLLKSDARLGRGLRAEQQVGDLIEHALVKPGCAFAHDVKEALKGHGNVDHVVMTPAGIWVVETKSVWVDRKRFPKALHQVASNVRRVRRHLGTSLPIRGALIIADRKDGALKKDYESEGVPVKAFDPKTFWELLRRERDQGTATGPSPDAARVERLVWRLGSKSHPQT